MVKQGSIASTCTEYRFHPAGISQQNGFSYIEVLVAMFILTIAILPAMDALHIGVIGTGIHQQTAQQQYALLKRMEFLETEAMGNLLAAAALATNYTTASKYSDPAGQSNRVLVYLGLYDADSDPFTVVDANTDADNNPYTGSTARLLWMKVQIENTPYSYESIKSR